MVVAAPADQLIALLVEENSRDALTSTQLQAHGAQVHLLHADSMTDARTILRETPVDVVILDLSLPDATGLEALHQVRVAASSVPIIVLTDTANEEMALEALRAGAQDYVLKPPPDGTTLGRILRYARERHLLLRELDGALSESATAARRWRLLAEVGKVFAASQEPGSAITGIPELMVPDAADCFVLYLVGDGESPTLIEIAHRDTREAAMSRDRVREVLPAPDALADGGESEISASLLEALEATSGVTVPVRFGGRARGLIVLAATADRLEAAVPDIEFGRSLANRIGLELEHARLFRQARHAVAASDRAVGIVSHDLRNPLSTIEICATALLDPEPPPLDGIRHMARIIRRSAAWMQQIAQDLLDRSSLDAGRLVLEREPTAVSGVIGVAQIFFAPVAQERGLEFVVETADDLPPVDVDPRRLQQVLSNLLSNAMKFTPAGGRVGLAAGAAGAEDTAEVRTPGSGGAVRFTVSDTGPGIPPEDLVHVFDWFWHTQSRTGSGTGLGLAIAQGLIMAHQCRLHVRSVRGEGTTFWFSIPTSDRSP